VEKSMGSVECRFLRSWDACNPVGVADDAKYVRSNLDLSQNSMESRRTCAHCYTKPARWYPISEPLWKSIVHFRNIIRGRCLFLFIERVMSDPINPLSAILGLLGRIKSHCTKSKITNGMTYYLIAPLLSSLKTLST